MKKEEIDFYQYGTRIATDLFTNTKAIAQKIKKDYGEDAKLEFECGLSVALSKQAAMSVEENVTQYLYSTSSINTADNMRNNSYFGGVGTSKQYDKNGYIEPHIKEK